MPAGLLKSELFGHEWGAFTGAVTRTTGRFQLAHQGTLFLDEIGDLPLELQPELLRVLQEQEFERLGSTRSIRVDVRVVAATNQDLEQMVQDRRFRADLFYRLNVFPIMIPPLRERQDDIPLLVRHFVDRFSRRMNRQISHISSAAMEMLRVRSRPGNIRELQNFIERAAIMSPGPELRLPPGELRHLVYRDAPAAIRTLADAERDQIQNVHSRPAEWSAGVTAQPPGLGSPGLRSSIRCASWISVSTSKARLFCSGVSETPNPTSRNQTGVGPTAERKPQRLGTKNMLPKMNGILLSEY